MTRTLFSFVAGLGLVLSLTVSVSGQVVISEVWENPEGTFDDSLEFIELYGRPGTDLTGYAIGLLKGGRDLNGDGIFEEVPEVDEAFTLDGLTLGSNGFLVLVNDTVGFNTLVDLNLIDPQANVAGFAAKHIPTSDTPGKLNNDGSSTYVLVRKRPDHSIDGNGQSVYGPNYGFRKDVRHDVNDDSEVDFGTEVNNIGTGDTAMPVEPYQIVDEFAWSNENGNEYQRDGEFEFSDTPGFNPDGVTRLRYFILNPQRGYRTIGNAGGAFSFAKTTIVDESFIYGETVDALPIDPNFLEYNLAIDLATGYSQTKAPTNGSATPYDGSCDPEPDNETADGCAANASGPYRVTDLDATGFKMTPGGFNDHPTNAGITQFRFIRGDFNCDGFINQIDRRLIEDRLGFTLDDTVADEYDPTPGVPGDEVAYQRYLRQGVEFQLVLMMLEMDTDDGIGGENAAAVTADDIAAFLAECPVCGGVGTPPAVQITEYMYSGNSPEFIEFTNTTAAPVDLTGWSYSDSARLPGQVDLTAFGIVAPGESVILTEDDLAAFHINWGLSGVKIIGDLTVNLGRNDEINLYDNAGTLADRLTYGDQTFPDTVRTQGSSGWPCDVGVGANDIFDWRLSIAGDAQGSYVSGSLDVGNPGEFVVNDCATNVPTGACCNAGTCISGPIVSQDYCIQIGGLYQGDGLTCVGITCPQPSNAIVRITEYMYSGANGEFIEVTNLDAAAVDMTGWSCDDSNRIQGTFPIGAIGVLQPGESAIITESTEAAFRTAWGLAPAVQIVGEMGVLVGNNLGRNDEINIYDAAGVLVDRLTYGDQTFPGTIRTQNFSGWPCNFVVGANDIENWLLSSPADAQNSFASTGGDVGSPGGFVLDPCAGANPIGACCLFDGTCVNGITETACDGLGGNWQGALTDCGTTDCPSPSDQQIRITEYMYSGPSGEFVEFTNVGNTPIDMTGWSYDDISRIPGSTPLSAFGVVQPGQSVILTEAVPGVFEAAWNLGGSGVVIVGPHGNNLGREDEINLYDASGQLVDRLTFGDDTVFPGSIRTQNITGWTCGQNLGQNDIFEWVLSTNGDAQSSYASSAGEIGNPGSFVEIVCGGPTPTGACCFIDGSCTDELTAEDCGNQAGAYQGDDSACVSANCPQPSSAQVRITEWMYSGNGGEFVEFTNVGDTPVDMTGWSYDDDSAIPDSFVLSAAGTLAPGESMIICEDAVEVFRAAWNLGPAVKIVGPYTNNLGRNDQINLYDQNDALVDRLSYGDQVFVGSIRTQNFSGWTCADALGDDDVFAWQLSAAADAQNSFASTNGDIGNPGVYVSVPCGAGCTTCAGDIDGNAVIEIADVQEFVSCLLGQNSAELCHCADMNGDAELDGRDVQVFTTVQLSASSCP